MQSEIELLERRLTKAEQRLRSTRIMAFGGVVSALVLAVHPEAQAQFAITLTSLQNQINALTPRVSALEDKTQFVSVSGGNMFITGTNLFIQNGLGATNGNPGNPFSSTTFSVNGKGNLIVGYNALRDSGNDRSGSHNLMVGDQLNYTRFGGIVVGLTNTIGGAWASVSGGIRNTASGVAASVSGGSGNIASGGAASASGGSGNIASGGGTSVSGGSDNTASGPAASISGGQFNTASQLSASVSGGDGNTASGVAASVSGGASITQATDGGWSGGSKAGSTVAGNFRSP